MRPQEVVKLDPHLAGKRGSRVIVGAVGGHHSTAGSVHHVALDSVGEKPGLYNWIK